MAVHHLGGVAIAYPTPDINRGITEPVISTADSRDLAVDLVAELRGDEQVAIVAYTIKRGEAYTAVHELSAVEMAALHDETREREVVGLTQAHWAETYRRWVEEGRVEPFASSEVSKTA